MNPDASSGPGLSIPGTLRLGLFQACLGFLAVVFAGLLNRVMVSELGFPGLLVGGALAFEQFVAPSRVLFGQISDRYAWAGRHRTPYILVGAAGFCGLAVLVVPVIFRLARAFQAQDSQASLLGGALLCGLFACYGLAVSMASTPYLALVIDRTGEKDRPRAVGIIWCMLTVGIVAGAVAISLSLRNLDGVKDPAVLEAVLGPFMVRSALVVFALTLLAVLGMEPAQTDLSQSAEREDAITLRRAWQLITSSRQVAIFFLFLVLFTLALFLQDPVLESYGAEVFGMPIAATAGLNALWGSGTLIGLVAAGWWIVPRLGPLATARLGCQLIAASMLLLLLAGLTAQVAVLKTVMLVFGLASGIGTNSTLCLMLDLTLPEAAGTFVGVWGLAQAFSRAVGKLLGGGLLDLGRAIGPDGSSFFPFALVLSIEALVAFAALWLLSALNLRQFREDTSRSLSRVLSLELG
ncbi:BCD family MFS transporter [Synechococcus sp. CS-1324]|uniref:BCD family MFS transporter n=1 Tax=unclassified Synechococcus TaxID=2626047 RepID=UPI000DB1D24E|nr:MULTISPECIES: BCD family MFS transporter [unclassified Synechococcus]MCT0212206.1 BCD family MFS transporter [Synechococcus sp. CS-1326]MCT0230471.1 BCD family MFS transporter [Synechococcus sp. CS-1324]MCT0233403.1 BCD family MFS transporter [Synechococcus sp. CS-1327]PZV03332.1 MAG: MFS transporter [Cyanobium sp.]